ncbi:hydroxyacid dehydrogenase [Salipiger sp. PrR002]|uniref:hydroxyacid dehydrogenase n=1 Tax=Salipiger sp. PrR002 TaxID=2706489 RepID=UPI0013B74AE9|nr:hydroxyacid dehydrogenase [Salipiger sp. PrR002]NDW01744.1 hydroxyacid dehydrogenase [Salipiger sp. PrR002]NDW57819.1 hydroxyacid dehydrogenase [Salipiger sp. PrR004]
MKVVISEFIDEQALGNFGSELRVDYDPAYVDTPASLRAALADAEALIVRNRTQVDVALLEAAPRLRVIGRLGVGLDNIDLGACRDRGIALHPATGANALPVAEYVIASMLVLLRGAYFSNAEMIRGDWPRGALMGGEASGRIIGLVGYGGIARGVAARARALGMTVAAFDPHIPAEDPAWAETRRCTLEELLGLSDVLSLHVPYAPETRGLIGADAIAKMKPGAIIINTARGGILDEDALIEALRDGRLGGAALDVFEVEPLTAEAGKRFDGIGNIILTPHIAGLTHEANTRVSEVTVRNVLRELGVAET